VQTRRFTRKALKPTEDSLPALENKSSIGEKMAKKYIKGKDGKFQGSVPDGNSVPKNVKIPNTAPKKSANDTRGKEWVVSYTLEDGSKVRGVQRAMYGHAAIDFYAKDNNLKYTSASSESKVNFDMFLSRGLRTPLEEDGQKFMTWEKWQEVYQPIHNPRNTDEGLWGCLFETHGEDVQYLQEHEPKENVFWTLVDNDPNSSCVELLPGVHAMNRLGYFITQKPWGNSRLVVTNNP
jgi:hypothetical protein